MVEATLIYLFKNKIPDTGWLINNEHLLLTVLRAGNYKTKVLANLAPAESPLPYSHMAAFSMSINGGWASLLFGVSYIRMLVH